MPKSHSHSADGHHRHGGHPHDHGEDHGHGHSHGHDDPAAHAAPAHHDHGEASAGPSRRLLLAFMLMAGFMGVEAVGGYLSHSLALTADAGHMLVDALSLGLAWFAQRLATRPRSDRRSFGYARAQVLAAFANSLLLLFIVAAIVVEAASRLLAPTAIEARTALLIGSLGAGVNLLAAWLLHEGHDHAHDLNTRAAYLHVLSDLAGSLAAVAAALIVLSTGYLAADAWLSLVVAALIARGAWRLLMDSAHVLQEGVPQGLNVQALQARLVEAVPAVSDVHHVHAWSLTARDVLITLHARLKAGADAGTALEAIKRVLVREYGISHSTVQLEPADCVDPEQHCDGEAVAQT
jgi:cobalt-zinc-cadmium efflux system protein